MRVITMLLVQSYKFNHLNHSQIEITLEAQYNNYYLIVSSNNHNDTSTITEFNHQGIIRNDTYSLNDKDLLNQIEEVYQEYVINENGFIKINPNLLEQLQGA